MVDTYDNAEDEECSSHESSGMFPYEDVRMAKFIPDEEGQESGSQDIESLTFYPNQGRSTLQIRPTERSDALLVTQCLLSRANDPLSVSDALSADYYEGWNKSMAEEMFIINEKSTSLPPVSLRGKEIYQYQICITPKARFQR